MADTERLPGPRLEDYEWQLEAACRVLDSTIFFHPPAARNIQRDSRIARAKAICRDCPAIVACRAWALRTMEPYGIWGGLSEDARTTLLGVPTLRWGGRRTTEDLREEQKSRLRRLLDDQHCDYYFKSDKDLSSYLMTRTPQPKAVIRQRPDLSPAHIPTPSGAGDTRYRLNSGLPRPVINSRNHRLIPVTLAPRSPLSWILLPRMGR
jgi:WhiB family redox-sensing transcriptional regulator